MLSERQLLRFWSKVNFGGPVHPRLGTRCWLWTGATARFGYGTVRIDKINHPTHRVAWQIATGEAVPDGLFVLHECDLPACIRFHHLKLGDAKMNLTDAYVRGRRPRAVHPNLRLTPSDAARGTDNGVAKLTDEEVVAIRAAYAKGRESQASIAARFGVDQTCISSIVRRATWTHI